MDVQGVSSISRDWCGNIFNFNFAAVHLYIMLTFLNAVTNVATKTELNEISCRICEQEYFLQPAIASALT